MLLLQIVATLIVAACVAASFRRVAFAAAPTSFDPDVLLAALRGEDGARVFPAICSAIRGADRPTEGERAEGDGATWERELLEALEQPAEVRAALVNEQLGELDWRMSRWARVPRVCASIASSTGFFMAAMAMRVGLADIGANGGSIFPDDGSDVTAMNGIVSDALGVVAIGMAGTAFCIACQMHARRIARARQESTDRLVERFEQLLLGAGKVG